MGSTDTTAGDPGATAPAGTDAQPGPATSHGRAARTGGAVTAPGRPRSRRAATAGVVAVLLAVAIVVPLWWRAAAGGTAGTGGGAGAGPDYGAAPSYTLTDQNGRTVSSTRFAGKVQVVSYLFPYCTTYCPVIARNLVLLRQRLQRDGLGGRVVLVAFNVDPAGAGPAQMRAFWAEFGGDPADPGFEFLTGSPDQIHAVVAGGFHVDYQKVTGADQPAGGSAGPRPTLANPLADRAHVNYDIQHNDFVEIVDGRGHVRALFDSGSQADPDQLLRAVRAALR